MRDGGGVRARIRLAIIGEPSPVTMPPIRQPDPVLDAHSLPSRARVRATGRVVSVNVSSVGVPEMPIRGSFSDRDPTRSA
jgi:hypothetical protein